LISLAAGSKSHAVDEDMFTPPAASPARRSRRQHGRTRSTAASPQEPELHFVDRAHNAVHFKGTVGVGDRCVRAKDPLPHPVEKVLPLPAAHHSSNNKTSRLQRCKKTCQKLLHLKQKQQLAQWKPFVAPFANTNSKNNNKKSSYNLTPRLVSYYEVTILAAPPAAATEPDDSNNRPQGKTECVAVGIALADFNLHKYMPGWDLNSFGYHGDDGALYHGAGTPIARNADAEPLPTFGAGDCVGCGIDYAKNALFYTKNGVFLGYVLPLTEEHLLQEWFPVVGVDTNCPVQCNFGTCTETPFQFDLSGLVAQQKDAVMRVLR